VSLNSVYYCIQAGLPLVLLFDWDDTISSHDTLSLIAPPEGTHPGPPFSTYLEAYLDDLRTHEANYSAGPIGTITTMEEQLKFLESLDTVELKSQERIESGGLFMGFDPIAMENRGRENVKLRRGWEEISQSSSFTGLELHIISVGWSARFIQASLRDTVIPTSICANEVEIDSKTGKGTGRLTKSNDVGNSAGRFGMRIAQHKMREMKRLLQGREDKVLKVFAGDSNTDLPCMLEADVGLILGDSKSLRDTITRLGLTSNLSQSVEEWKQKRKSRGAAPKPDLIFVGDWFMGLEVIETLQA
jgi:hypothetical protein